MVLKAKAPVDVKPSKPKMLISGESGVGKTFFALDFPKPYLFDTESGATREQYQAKLKKSGGVYFGKEEGSQSFESVINETKQLCTEKHNYRTAIYDSFTYLYMLEAADAEAKGGSDFGRDKKMANIPTRQLISTLEKLDMNVILICHSKDKWERKTSGNKEQIINVGSTFDGYDKLEYILDLWVEILKGGKTFMVRKSRISSLVQGNSYPLSYDKFAELYGKEVLEKESVPVIMANFAQLTQLGGLIEALNIPIEQQEKVLKSFNSEDWKDLTEVDCQKVIESLQKKIKSLTNDNKTEPKNGQAHL